MLPAGNLGEVELKQFHLTQVTGQQHRQYRHLTYDDAAGR
jgi:hypothetical protein